MSEGASDLQDFIELPAAEGDLKHGHKTAEESRARQRWKAAVRAITLTLRLRRRFAWIGAYLKQENVKDLTRGLERKKGVLVRVNNYTST